MHEHAIAEEILRQARLQGPVKRIVVEVGDLAHLPADEMRKALEARVPWRVEILERRAKVRCQECGFVGEPRILQKAHDATLFECPICKALPLVLDGEQIVLRQVELDE
ncbi:MAG: hydrogenase maturation nickel metallochaperone HypA [Nitrosarchaeum sp.]|nr:hydrogenase maturation nickel metallochaperone HypA [Nitrosarchaeum sp.]